MEKYNDDLSELKSLLEKNSIPFVYEKHLGATPKIKELIGYYPTGEWQIIVNNELSIIRGYASFGNYEMMRIKGKGKYSDEPIRIETAEEILKLIKGVIWQQ